MQSAHLMRCLYASQNETTQKLSRLQIKNKHHRLLIIFLAFIICSFLKIKLNLLNIFNISPLFLLFIYFQFDFLNYASYYLMQQFFSNFGSFAFLTIRKILHLRYVNWKNCCCCLTLSFSYLKMKQINFGFKQRFIV